MVGYAATVPIFLKSYALSDNIPYFTSVSIYSSWLKISLLIAASLSWLKCDKYVKICSSSYILSAISRKMQMKNAKIHNYNFNDPRPFSYGFWSSMNDQSEG